MKKITLLLAFIAMGYYANAQAQKYLNFGGLGTGLYIGYEIPVAKAISLVPQAHTNYDFDNFVISVKGNYYFDELFGINSDWDVYAGVGGGWRIDNGPDDNGGFDFGAQIGGRWFWSEKWGLNGEFGWSRAALGGLGVTMKF